MTFCDQQEKFSLTLAPIFKRPRCPRHPQPSTLECCQKYLCPQYSKLEVLSQNHGGARKDSKPHDEGQCLRSTRRSACPLQLLRNIYSKIFRPKFLVYNNLSLTDGEILGDLIMFLLAHRFGHVAMLVRNLSANN